MRLPDVRVVLAGLVVVLAAVAPAAQAAAPLGAATPLAYVGPGATESSQRQVVRTQDDVVYIASVEDDGWGGGAFADLHMYRATTAGVPNAFASVDEANDPRVKNPLTLSGGDARIDAQGTIHLTYSVVDGDTLTVRYQTFDTRAGKWGAAEDIVTLPSGRDGKRGFVVSGLAIDAKGAPLIVTASSSGVSGWSRAAAGKWSREPIDGAYGLHPSLAFDASGRALLAWASSPYANPSIRYAARSADGTWSRPEIVASADVLTNDTADQSPSLAYGSDGRPAVLWLDANDLARVSVRGAQGGWTSDDPPSTFTHTPGLYARGDDRFVFLGHDVNVHPAYLSSDPTAGWSSVLAFAPPANLAGRYAYDGSASARFDPLFDPDCRTIDVVFFDEDSDLPGRSGGGKPDLFYAAVTLPAPAGGCPRAPGLEGSPTTPPPTDPPPTTPPPTDPPPTTPPPTDPPPTTPPPTDPPPTTPPPTDPPPHNEPPPATPSATLLGSTAVAPQIDANSAGMAEAFQTVASSAGTIRSISVYVDGASTGEKVAAGLYADAGSHPGALLAQGSAVAAEAGAWNAVELPATPVMAGQRYWIAILGTGAGQVSFRDDPVGGCRSETSASSSLADLPQDWSTGSEYADCPVSAFASTSATPPAPAPTARATRSRR
jgi:hypothetical protein